MATYSVISSLCPALVTPASLLRPGTDAAPVTRTPTVGATSSAVTLIDKLAMNLDITGRRGGGAYAVTEGLDLSASGLTCTVTAGQAMLDGVVTLAASATVTLADNAYNWVWLLQDGTLTKTSSATTTVPAAPSAACAFLGRIQVTAGTPGTPDYSGRWELRNGTLWRRTGDAGMPDDSPASTLLFLTVTAGGTYLWNGVAYSRLRELLDLQPLSIGASEAFTIPAGYQVVLSELTVSGTLTVSGIAVFVGGS